jgi:iron complex outermembrane receptor protein
MQFFLLFVLFSLSLNAEEKLSSLLNSYKHESELSKITKKEEAGVVDIYTRHDLEVMQAKTLEDVLRILPGFHLTRTSNNLTSLQKPTLSSVQLTSMRLYINDHDMSSSSFGSAALIWGELPIEYIDHIEIYKGASSIEFGNEAGSIILKLYTKTPQHEEGGKLRLYGDNEGSTNLDTYVASTVDNFSYFTYANINNINRTEYTNLYQDSAYSLKSDHSGHNLYANLQYKEWILELGSYYKESDNFLGIGTNRTPTDGGLNAYHNYMHLTKKFQNSIKLQLSYDKLSYKRRYVDPNGISIANAPTINDYNIKFDDEIFSTTLEKKFKSDKHSLLLGSFYKRKKFTEHGSFDASDDSYLYNNSFSNALNLYSAYAEYIYNYDLTTRLIASLKEDFFEYDKAIPSRDELSTKLGVIKKIDDFQVKAFVTTSYVPTAFYQLYNPTNIPYKTNPNLDNMHLIIETFSVKYAKDKHKVKVIIAKNKLKDIVIYNRDLTYGYENSSNNSDYLRLDFKYTYLFDLNNKFVFDIFNGKNSNDTLQSPKYGSIIQLFSKYKKFDIYNELTYKSSYDYLGLSLDAAWNYIASVKYHYTKDLSLGLRGENIFNSGYKQAYKGLDYAIPVTDQKIWFNLEYLF